MTLPQIIKRIQLISTELATIKARQASDHVKIEENKALATQIYKLTATIENLTAQMEKQNENVEKIANHSESSSKSQGERLGKVEHTQERTAILLEKSAERLSALEDDMKEIKSKGSKRWEAITEKIMLVITAALLGYIFSRIGLIY